MRSVSSLCCYLLAVFVLVFFFLKDVAAQKHVIMKWSQRAAGVCVCVRVKMKTLEREYHHNVCDPALREKPPSWTGPPRPTRTTSAPAKDTSVVSSSTDS